MVPREACSQSRQTSGDLHTPLELWRVPVQANTPLLVAGTGASVLYFSVSDRTRGMPLPCPSQRLCSFACSFYNRWTCVDRQSRRSRCPGSPSCKHGKQQHRRAQASQKRHHSPPPPGGYPRNIC